MHKWLSILKMTIVLFTISYGSIMNAGFVGAFYVNRTLKKKGNPYLIALGVADLSITLIVIPIYAVMLINNQVLPENLCSIMQLFSKISTDSYNLLTMFVGFHNYLHGYPGCRMNALFKAVPATLAIWIIVFIATVIEIVGIYSNLNFNFCNNEHHGNLQFRIIIDIFVHFLPAVFSFNFLASAAKKARMEPREIIIQIPNPEGKLNYTIIDLNIYTYFLYFICWMPCLISTYIQVDDILYNYLPWIGLMRSGVGSSLYIIFNKHFRRGFVVIFNYICCPITLGFSDTSSEHQNTSMNVIPPLSREHSTEDEC